MVQENIRGRIILLESLKFAFQKSPLHYSKLKLKPSHIPNKTV